MSNLATELAILESLIKEQNKNTDQYTIPFDAVGHIRDFVKAVEAVLILFDLENRDWANKKMLREGGIWTSGSAFPLKDSILCKSIRDEITFIDYRSRSLFDPAINDIITPIRKIMLAPLKVTKTMLGAVIFINPAFDEKDEGPFEFLKVMISMLANAIQAAERNRQLIVTNADLEASYWQILNSRNTLRTFFDNLPSGVHIVDHSHTIIAVNNHRSERVGKKPQELVGEKCYKVLHGYSTPCAECRVMDALNGIPSVRTLREIGPNDTFVHWEISTVPIRENNNAIQRVIVFEEDVTEKWILEANLIQAEKMASIGQLAANVAHEINNPLAAIIANAQLLRRDLSDPDENTVDALKLIETAGDRAAKIVSNLLESARKDKHYEFEEISLNDTITDAISLLRFEINKRSISVKLDLADELPVIFANKNQLKGVWINLINNAIGAIETPRGEISVSTRHENKEFYVVFSDNGKGIDSEHQSHIFEPFFTTKEVGKGTGLGLSVSLQAIKEHRGDIQFESTPGKGTKFMITLPELDPDLD